MTEIPTPGPATARAAEPATDGDAPRAAASPTVSVVIATRDRLPSLRAAMEAVRAALRPGDELVVVDSASADPGVGAAAAALGATVVRCDAPGTSRARNAGARAAAGDVVAFTDDDCVPSPDWVEALAAQFRRYPELGFLTGSVAPLVEGRRRRLHLSVVSSADPVVYPPAPDVDGAVVGHGANMAWRRDALARIGGFDETLGPGAVLRAAEDQDAFWRARRAGVTGRYEPTVVVRHRQWRGLRGQMAAFHGYGVGAGAMWVKRWRAADSRTDTGRRAGGAPATAGRHPGARPAGGLRSLLGSASGRRALRALLWDDGAGAVTRRLRDGYQLGALSEAVEMAGAITGVRRAWRRRIVDGHFQ